MEEIKGLKIPFLTFTPKKIGDLLYYDGPLLSHFIDEERPKDNYLYRWVDNDAAYNRWLIFKVSIEELILFFEQELSLRKLIEHNQSVTLIDFDDELNVKNIMLTTVLNLPESYLPAVASNFKPEFYHKYALQLKDTLLKKQDQASITLELLNKVDKLEAQQGLILKALKTLSLDK